MKMIKNIRIFRILALPLLLCTGCESFLDTVPDNRTELDTNEKIARLLVSAYSDANYASAANAMADDATCRVGLATASKTSNPYIVNEDAYYWRETRLPSHNDSPGGFWNGCYMAIATANHALEVIEQHPDQDEVRYLKSEALLCRSFFHFLLVNLFAKPYQPGEANISPGIPYVDKAEKKVLETYERKTVQYVYDRIEADMTEAFKNLPPESGFKVPAYHFTAKAAITFASRFYLYKGEFDKVVALTSQLAPIPVKDPIFGNVPESDPANVWAKTYFAAFKEWGTTFDNIANSWWRSEGKHNFLLTETYSTLTRSWTCQYGTIESFLPTSTSKNITGGYWPFTSYTPTSFKGCTYLYKFTEYFFWTSSSGGLPYVMFPFIRAEEVLLNRIEAEIHLDRLDAAVNDLNVYYRQRSGATKGEIISPYQEATMVLDIAKIKAHYAASLDNNFLKTYKAYNADTWSDDKIALMLTLLDTRKAEYTHEGMRWFDVLRYRIPVHHKSIDGEDMHLRPDDPRRQWQIPEIAVKFGLEPNPR
jgi:hypothetical protein